MAVTALAMYSGGMEEVLFNSERAAPKCFGIRSARHRTVLSRCSRGREENQ